MARTRLARTLLRARATWRATDAIRALAAWGAPVLGALVALFVLDNLLHLPGWLRAACGALWLLAAAGTFALFVFPVLARRRSFEATARMLEERLAVDDNVLINALQLARDADKGSMAVPEAALDEITAQADDTATGIEVGRLWRLRPIQKALRYGSVAVGVAFFYFVVFSSYAQNALRRYSDPLGEVAPLTIAIIEVEPGDTQLAAGDTLTVKATVSVRHGALPETARLRFRSAGEPWQTRPMTRAATDGFSERVGPLTSGLAYRVEAGDAKTRVFNVTVIRPPTVHTARLVLTPPAYTGQRPSEVLQPTVIRALRDSRATLSFTIDRERIASSFSLPGAPEQRRTNQTPAFEFKIRQPGTAVLALDGRPDAWSAPIVVLEDSAPRVTLSSEAPRQLLPPGATLPLTASADDDFGVASVRFVVHRQSNNATSTLKSYRCRAPGEKRVVERLVVPLDPQAFVPGEQYAFWAEAIDFHPGGEHLVRSRPVVVRIARPGELTVDRTHPLASPFEQLRRLADRQRTAVAQSMTLGELFKDHVAKGRFVARTAEMAGNQRDIIMDARNVAFAFRRTTGGGRYADELDRLDREEFKRIGATLTKRLKTNRAAFDAVQKVLPEQRKALAALDALLGRIALAAAKQDTEAPEEGEEPIKPWQKELQKKLEKLKEFIEEQRKLIELTRELEAKSPEDWTEEDQKALGRLEAQELKWARFFEEAFTDLSKVPDQDFADSHLADEFNSVYMEVKKAAEALSAKKIEIAVPTEQAGLELAEELVHNLERWIPDTPDHTKWVMEEPTQDFDVPLADLPDELEDIVGDLIDDADSMDESVEDVSSSWMDSLDHGAGWDASGGPISNMSAKGITGNRLPNTDEIGGRSGEGRSGKSHGQFVEKTAEGKGGRETPTRLTEDPFESGAVDDKSNEASGGATGGGKLAGQGMEGLRGKVPPPIADKLQRLANNQGELRQRAERLSRTLRKLHLPAGDVEDAARLLGWSENHLKNAVGFELREAHANVKAALERARASLKYEADTLRESGVRLPDRVRDELMGGMRRKVPTGYEDILRAYYKAIAEGR